MSDESDGADESDLGHRRRLFVGGGGREAMRRRTRGREARGVWVVAVSGKLAGAGAGYGVFFRNFAAG